PALEHRSGRVDDLHAAVAVDGRDGDLASRRTAHEQLVIERAGGVERDPVQARHGAYVGEGAHALAQRIDAVDSNRLVEAQHKSLVPDEAAAGGGDGGTGRFGEVRLGAGVLGGSVR